MIVEETRRPQPSGQKVSTGGWTSLHSWIFLAIVALGLTIIAVQNRYHYLSPVGLGKAYRIDKLFGGIQEFEPNQGWIKAELHALPPQQAMPMADSHGAQLMQIPGAMQPGMVPPGAYGSEPILNLPQSAKEEIRQPKEPNTPAPAAQQNKAKETPETMTMDQKFAAFKKVFPNFGKDEFMLANDDLYPDWKKNVSPSGNWNDFLNTYGQFIQWWNDAGSPSEAGFKLWRDFMSSTRKQ